MAEANQKELSRELARAVGRAVFRASKLGLSSRDILSTLLASIHATSNHMKLPLRAQAEAMHELVDVITAPEDQA